jgi:hypothetical protein
MPRVAHGSLLTSHTHAEIMPCLAERQHHNARSTPKLQKWKAVVPQKQTTELPKEQTKRPNKQMEYMG